MPLVFGQRKVLQSVSLRRDRAGLAHLFIFWGFISFLLSYILFIFGDSAWAKLSDTLLTETGVRVFVYYLDVLAVVFLAVLCWAAARRWIARPHRLLFDLTQKRESAIILVLIGTLMVLTLLTEAFHTASGGEGPHAAAPVGAALGTVVSDLGVSEGTANGLQGLFWWLHLGIILGFGIYIPLSKHMHIMGAPVSFLMRSLEARGTLSTPTNLETAESFGAARIEEFTWKELLDGYACAVCGRCTDSCPAHLTGKILSPMHIVENLKDHLLETGPGAGKDRPEEQARPLLGNGIPGGGDLGLPHLWGVRPGVPVGVEHIDTIVDVRRHLVMEQASMPETAMNALLSMEQRGHPWRGTTYTRTDWAEGLDVRTLADHPDAELLFWVGCTPHWRDAARRWPGQWCRS